MSSMRRLCFGQFLATPATLLGRLSKHFINLVSELILLRRCFDLMNEPN